MVEEGGVVDVVMTTELILDVDEGVEEVVLGTVLVLEIFAVWLLVFCSVSFVVLSSSLPLLCLPFPPLPNKLPNKPDPFPELFPRAGVLKRATKTKEKLIRMIKSFLKYQTGDFASAKEQAKSFHSGKGLET